MTSVKRLRDWPVVQLIPDDRDLVSGHARLIEQQQQIMASRRRWSFQSFRLQRTLDQQQNQPASG
jgi:hypothetical protein